jgi:hypothetical protein
MNTLYGNYIYQYNIYINNHGYEVSFFRITLTEQNLTCSAIRMSTGGSTTPTLLGLCAASDDDDGGEVGADNDDTAVRAGEDEDNPIM